MARSYSSAEKKTARLQQFKRRPLDTFVPAVNGLKLGHHTRRGIATMDPGKFQVSQR